MKYLILTASVVIQICLGGVYAFSALVPAMKDTLGLSTAQTQVIFGGLFATFTVSMVQAGRIIDRLGPRKLAGIGGLLFGAGYLVASLSGGHFAVLLLGYSILAGIGTGFGYACPLAVGMRWFPNRRGLVTGVCMAGFGGGAVLLSSLAEYLLSGGMNVLVVLRWVGVAYGVAILAAAALLTFPAEAQRRSKAEALDGRRLLRDPFFSLLVLGMFAGTFAGMLVIGNLKEIALSVGIASVPATASISAFAAGNAAGRILWGWLCDRTDQRVIPIKLLSLGLPLAALGLVKAPGLFICISFLVGFGFGACFVVYASQVASRYGPARVAGVYPLVFLAYGVAGIVGPVLGGWLFDVTASYIPAIAAACAVVAIGMACSLVLLRRINPAGQEICGLEA